MRNQRMSRIALILASLTVTAVLSSCSCKIKEEQQTMINKLRTEERQLTSDTETAERNRTRISSELNSRQGEVRQCNERKAFVQDKMSRWPNIWPDWDPNAPVVAPEPTPTKKR
ncbi:MAG: hypothetical protein SGJ05_08730 [bacterium]|nr:hypothetical protein [bacterium]